MNENNFTFSATKSGKQLKLQNCTARFYCDNKFLANLSPDLGLSGAIAVAAQSQPDSIAGGIATLEQFNRWIGVTVGGPAILNIAQLLL